MSAQQNWENTVLIGRTLRGLFTRETPVRQLMGPVGDRRDVGHRGRARLAAALQPDGDDQPEPRAAEPDAGPVLDGGHIAILAVEGSRAATSASSVKERILMAGAALIVLLMVTVIYNDIARLLR